MRYLLPLALAFLTLSGCLDDDDTPVPLPNQTATIIVTDELKFPEGIAYDPATSRVYTGSTVDGTIYGGNKTDARLQTITTSGSAIAAAVGMEVSGTNLYVAGGPTGSAYVINLTNSQVRELTSAAVPTGDSTFINDVTIGSNGTAYMTNSFFPVLYRYMEGDSLESWINLDSTIIDYQNSFNLNGIAISDDDRYVLTVQSNTGNLYRIDATDRSVSQVTISGGPLTAGDGIELVGDLLYVVRNQTGEIVAVSMNADYSQGQVIGVTTGAFRFPTTIAATSDSLLVLNGQLDQRGPGGNPVLPFTITKFLR